jgi:hypothetical protein
MNVDMFFQYFLIIYSNPIFCNLLYLAPTSTDCKGNNWQKGPGTLCFQINHVLKTWEGKSSHRLFMLPLSICFQYILQFNQRFGVIVGRTLARPVKHLTKKIQTLNKTWFFCVGVMYSGEYDACDVTLSVYPHRASLKNMPDHGGNITY